MMVDVQVSFGDKWEENGFREQRVHVLGFERVKERQMKWGRGIRIKHLEVRYCYGSPPSIRLGLGLLLGVSVQTPGGDC